MARFISRDPIRFRGGDINLYRAFGNNGINLLDPYGLENTSGAEAFSIGGYAGLGDSVTGKIVDNKNTACPDCSIWEGKRRIHKKIEVIMQAGVGLGGTFRIGGFGVDLSLKDPQIMSDQTVEIIDECDGTQTGGGCNKVGIDAGMTFGVTKIGATASGGISNFGYINVCVFGSSATGKVTVDTKLCFNSIPSGGGMIGPFYESVYKNLVPQEDGCVPLTNFTLKDYSNEK